MMHNDQFATPKQSTAPNKLFHTAPDACPSTDTTEISDCPTPFKAILPERLSLAPLSADQGSLLPAVSPDAASLAHNSTPPSLRYPIIDAFTVDLLAEHGLEYSVGPADLESMRAGFELVGSVDVSTTVYQLNDASHEQLHSVARGEVASMAQLWESRVVRYGSISAIYSPLAAGIQAASGDAVALGGLFSGITTEPQHLEVAEDERPAVEDEDCMISPPSGSDC